MNDGKVHRQHGARSGSKGGRSSSRRGTTSPYKSSWGRLALKCAVAAIASLAIVVFIVGHFASMDVATAAKDPTWPSDGAADDLGQAAAALGSTPPALDDAEVAAKRALAASPLSITALDLLAQIAKAAGDQEAVARYRNLILDRTLRNFASLRWKYDEALGRRDYAAMMRVGDSLLRQDIVHKDARYVIGTLAFLAADDTARPLLIDALSRPSIWRANFLNALAGGGPVDAFPLVIDNLPADPAAPSSWSWNVYLDRLTRRGESRKAYVMWAAQLPPEQLESLGYMYNGGFEDKPSGMLFDWRIDKAKGLEVAFDEDNPGEGTRSLRVTFGGGSYAFQNVRQQLVLDPGRYRLSGTAKTDDLQTVRGISWGIYCLDPSGNRQIAASPSFSGTSDWTPFETDFEVPADGCNDQIIQLELPARIDSERRIQGRIWLDSLAIARQPEADATAPTVGGE